MPALGGDHDERALALADRVDEIDQPLAQILRIGLEVDQLVRVDRRQVVEVRPATSGLDVDAVHGLDPQQAAVLLAFDRRTGGAADAIPDAQAEAADLGRGDVDVVGARQQAVAAHEAVALVDDVEDAGGVDVAGALRLALEDAVDEVVLAIGRNRIEVEVARDGSELRHAHGAQIGDIEVVPLARGFELLQLVVLRHGGTTGGGAPTRATISGTRVRTVRGHGEGDHLGETTTDRAQTMRSAGRGGMGERYERLARPSRSRLRRAISETDSGARPGARSAPRFAPPVPVRARFGYSRLSPRRPGAPRRRGGGLRPELREGVNRILREGAHEPNLLSANTPSAG